MRKGQPSVPFIAVAEAHALRSLRPLGLRMSEIREAAAAVRDDFDTPYGLVSKRIATDGVDRTNRWTSVGMADASEELESGSVSDGETGTEPPI